MIYMLMRDAEGRKKKASKVIQTTKQSNTTHQRQSLFHVRLSCTAMPSMPRFQLSQLSCCLVAQLVEYRTRNLVVAG